MNKKRFSLKRTICVLLLSFFLFEEVKNCIYVVRHGVVSLMKANEYSQFFVQHKGKKYFRLISFSNRGQFSDEDSDFEPSDEIGFSMNKKNILYYLIPYPNMFKYYFWQVKYDPNEEFIMHLGFQSDERAIYIREDILREFYKNNILLTYKEQCLIEGKDISDCEDEDLYRYVVNEGYGGLVILDNEKGERIFVMNKPYLRVLNKIRTSQGKRVEFDKGILLRSSYQLRFYENELPKPKQSDYLVVINNQYIYVQSDDIESASTRIVGTIIEDESAIESIEDGGKQVFTKERGIAVDNLAYLSN